MTDADNSRVGRLPTTRSTGFCNDTGCFDDSNQASAVPKSRNQAPKLAIAAESLPSQLWPDTATVRSSGVGREPHIRSECPGTLH